MCLFTLQRELLKNVSVHLGTLGNSISDNYKELKKCALCSTVCIRDVYMQLDLGWYSRKQTEEKGRSSLCLKCLFYQAAATVPASLTTNREFLLQIDVKLRI